MLTLKEIIRQAKRQGWIVERSRRGYRFAHPDPTVPILFTHISPSDNRAAMNLRKDLERRGFIYSK